MRLLLSSLFLFSLSVSAQAKVCFDCTVPEELRGSWHLKQVRCNGTPSLLISDAGLASGTYVESTVSFDGDNGSRLWYYYGCTQTVAMTGITVANGTITLTQGSAACSGMCQGYGACGGATQQNNFSYTMLDAENLKVTIPITNLYVNPCAGLSGDSPVDFLYEKITAEE